MGGCHDLTCTRPVPHHGGQDVIIFARHPDGSYQMVGSFHVRNSRAAPDPDGDRVSREMFATQYKALRDAWQAAAERLFGDRAPQIECVMAPRFDLD